MNTKLLMISSAITLAVIGIVLTFLPKEILAYLGMNISKTLELIIQITGAFFLAFAMLNWMTRASLIGGIYNRPIASANFTHFFIAGISLIKGVIANPSLPYAFWIIAIVYSIFALLFGIVIFRHPVKGQ